MTPIAAATNEISFNTFGAYLRFLRRRARLTQRELAVAVNYSEGQICHLERGRRAPELATLAALFVPALHLEQAPEESAQLLALAAAHHATARAEQDNGDQQASTLVLSGSSTPALASPLIGRAQQQVAIGAMLREAHIRLLTLIGPPGVGKTHLALQLTHDLRDHFPDGVHFIDLSPVRDASQVAVAIAQALTIGEQANSEPLASLQEGLRTQQTMLVLDNFEQVVDAAPLLVHLLAAAPGLKLLITSRVALRIQAEQLVSVPPLPIPNLAQLPELDQLARIDSVALLLARLRAVNPELELTRANALPLAAICVKVDGLPLAIELVASRGRLLGPHELLSEVAQRFQQLRRRGRDILPRHETLTAALGWSYEQLSPEAQVLFARLSVFVGKWSLTVVEAVCDVEHHGMIAMLDQLEELIEHSLIQRHHQHGETYLSMLTMMREYGQAQLHARAEAELIYQRLLDTFIQRAEQAEQQLSFSANQALWMARLETEYDTIRMILGRTIESGAHGQGQRLVGALWRFWYMRGMLREGRQWLETFLALPLVGNKTARAHALDGAGIIAWRQGEFHQAEVWLNIALDLYRSERHQRGEARVLSHIGLLKYEQGAFAQALQSYEASLSLNRALGDSIGVAAALHNIGNLHCQQNNHEQAMELYTECLAIYEHHGSQADIALVSLGIGAIARDQGQIAAASSAFLRSLKLAQELGDDWSTAIALLNLGDIARDYGDLQAARHHYDAALAIQERLGDQSQAALVQSRLALVAFRAGDRATAIHLFRQSLMLANALEFPPGIVDALEGLANCAAPDRAILAARLYATAAAIRERLDLPISLAEQLHHEQALHSIQQTVEPAVYAIAWAEGRSMAPTQAIALALTHVSIDETNTGGQMWSRSSVPATHELSH